MSEGGVLTATVSTAKRHPWLIGGGFLALVLLLYVFGRSKTVPAPASFQFSYGPTNAQIQAGTQLAIAEHEDQTRVSLANTSAGIYSDYFDYLSSSGKANNTASVQEAQIAADTSKYTVNANAQAAIKLSQMSNQTAQAATAAQLSATLHGQDTALQTVNLNDAAAKYVAQLTAQTAQTATAAANYQAGLSAQTKNVVAYYDAQKTNAANYYAEQVALYGKK
jgi:hypothetical protein